MKNILLTAAIISSTATHARPNLSEAKQLLDRAPLEIKTLISNAPKVYAFESNFDGKDNVSYTGQTFRQVLVDELKHHMGSLKRGSYPGSERNALGSFNTFFKYKSQSPTRGAGSINGLSRHNLRFKDQLGQRAEVAEGTTLNSILNPGKDLVSKIAGNDNPLRHGELLGWNSAQVAGINLNTIDADRKGDNFVEPEDFVQAIFQLVAKNAATGKSFTVANGNLEPQRVDKAYVTEDGVDWNQIMHKFLQGAIHFSQASGDYLATDLGDGKGLYSDNSEPYKGNQNYTALEHFWDEGFGYFGAARDYAQYSDELIMQKFSIDSNQDGKISVHAEKNIGGAATNAARMDFASKNFGEAKLNLTYDVIQAFSAGRLLINKKPTDYMKYVEANATIAVAAWERALAAVVIHYLNSTLEIMDEYGSQNYLFINHAKFWSEMKGFALAFQFNPTSMISVENFKKVHQLMGDHPVLMSATDAEINDYRKALNEAKEILRTSFEFSDLDADAF